MVEYAVYGAPGELPALPDLRAVTGGAQIEISTTELPDDWSERWKQFHRPVLIEAPAPGQRPQASGRRRCTCARRGSRRATVTTCARS